MRAFGGAYFLHSHTQTSDRKSEEDAVKSTPRASLDTNFDGTGAFDRGQLLQTANRKPVSFLNVSNHAHTHASGRVIYKVDSPVNQDIAPYHSRHIKMSRVCALEVCPSMNWLFALCNGRIGCYNLRTLKHIGLIDIKQV